jgi:hypothetical protein
MANRTATLYIRISKNGRSPFCKPVYQSKGRLKPQYAMIKGEPEHHNEGVYRVRLGTVKGKQQFVLVGKGPSSLWTSWRKRRDGCGSGNGKLFLQRLQLETGDK